MMVKSNSQDEEERVCGVQLEKLGLEQRVTAVREEPSSMKTEANRHDG